MTRRSDPIRALFLLSAFSAVSLLSGCSARVDGPRELTIAAGRYPEAFDAAREVLRGLDFDLERVDASAGVLSTEPHFARGLFEPWDGTQTGFTDEWDDAMNMQARAVRITFTQSGGPPADESADTLASVWVTVYRNNRSGRRLDSEWVGGSTFAGDPLQNQRHGSNYLVPMRRDGALESRLVDKLTKKLGVPAPAAQPEDAQAGDLRGADSQDDS